MFGKLLQHLVQFYDDIHNENRPTIECGILDSLQGLHITAKAESNLTGSPHGHSPGSFGHDYALDPLLCLNESSQFHMCQETVDHEALYSNTCTPLGGTITAVCNQRYSRYHQASSFIGSGVLSSPPRVYGEAFAPFGITESFVGSPPFASGVYGLGIDQLSGTSTGDEQAQSSHSAETQATSQLTGSTDSPMQRTRSIFLPTEPTQHRNLTNIFVANFPAHWGKSDLVDLFEGIPIASVHVLPEKRTGMDEGASGGTGFVNVIRREDAEALLGLLDKKIWLIEGSALKFRLANSSAPSESFALNATHRIRTMRRHPYKILDRLRAEQTIGKRQVGACDKHQIVVFKNMSSDQKTTLSIVQGSRQRNNHMSCAHMENGSRPSNQRTLIDELRAYLNRSNRYNQQQTFAPPPPSVKGPAVPLPSTRQSNSESMHPSCALASSSTLSLHLSAPFIPAAHIRSLGVVPGYLPMTERSLLMDSSGSIPASTTQLGFLPQATGGTWCYLAVHQPPQTTTTPGYFRAVPCAHADENNPMSGQMLQNMWID